MTQSLTVHQLTTLILDLIESEPQLQDVWVEGEISNFTRAASGHLYFTLKDDRSELRCVMWKSNAMWLGFEPQHGDQLLAHGRVSVYEGRGYYQLVCDALQAAGAGDLNRQFELLKARLEQEGLFDPARKRPIPPFPRQIGIVTSPTTAAFQDIQNVIRRRWPGVGLVLSPTPVQGADAPPKIVAAIQRLNDHTNVDIILVARGGGSLEDLWCFNDESVVRAVATSRIPVVTGVGHEIDFTLVDFAADLRAPTPSAAAEVITPDRAALQTDLDLLRSRMDEAARALVDERRARIADHLRWLERLAPDRRIETARQRLDDLAARLDLHARFGLDRRRERLAAQARALESANPRALLSRGYALVTRREDGHRVTRALDAAEGTTIIIHLQDGRLTAQVRQRDFEGE